jgi:flagellin
MALPLAIMTNAGSITAQSNLIGVSRGLQESIGRLSSGIRINSAADDAAGMAVSENMRAQLKGFQQAMRNSNDAISILQTAESGYQSVSDMLIRMRELAVQSANDSLSDTERAYLNTEFADLISEIDRVADSVEYNGIKLLNGSANGSGTMTFQVGTRNSSNDRITVRLVSQNTGSSALAVSGLSVGGLSSAQAAIGALDTALETLAEDRATLGSTINSLTKAVDHLSSTIENYGNSVSQIRDTDMAAESSVFAKNQVLQQAGVAMLSQANALPNLALRLLG